ncbi:hypothetical protein L2E82_25213 [Cichorium intybus]|uniref:Uncharacterized protein n=1 Tax=Cichorium intybus TaxID=13427 RepID=A0ACB9E2Z1_CICIN|nr:hypothetical protein L2E82_25213 [Cichorium intybus]
MSFYIFLYIPYFRIADVDGLYNGPPSDPGLKLIHTYVKQKHQKTITFGDKSRMGRGGIDAKVKAASNAAYSGTPVVIARMAMNSVRIVFRITLYSVNILEDFGVGNTHMTINVILVDSRINPICHHRRSSSSLSLSKSVFSWMFCGGGFDSGRDGTEEWRKNQDLITQMFPHPVESIRTYCKKLIQGEQIPPPPLVQEMFCMKLQQDDYVAAFSEFNISF